MNRGPGAGSAAAPRRSWESVAPMLSTATPSIAPRRAPARRRNARPMCRSRSLKDRGRILHRGAPMRLPRVVVPPLLHLAAEGGNKNVVQALLDGGADVSKENEDGDSALHLAADWGNIDVVQVLVNAKADISKKNKAGLSARDVAARSNYRQITAIMDRAL